jgi:hypothetical protein
MTVDDYLLIVLNGLTDHPNHLGDHFYREYKKLKHFKVEEFVSNLQNVCKLLRQMIERQFAERSNAIISPKPKRETEPLHLGQITNFQFSGQICLTDIEKVEKAILGTRDKLGQEYRLEEKAYREQMYKAEFNEYRLRNSLGEELDFIEQKIAEQDRRIESYKKEILAGQEQYTNQLKREIEYRNLLIEKQKAVQSNEPVIVRTESPSTTKLSQRQIALLNFYSDSDLSNQSLKKKQKEKIAKVRHKSERQKRTSNNIKDLRIVFSHLKSKNLPTNEVEADLKVAESAIED